MAHAYTPGLKVTETITLKKNRILPLKGNVVVEKGQEVEPDTVVARTDLPGKVISMNAANRLGVPPEDIEQTLLVKKGETMSAGTVFAMHKSFFGLFKSVLKAPESCSIENVSSVTGNILLRGDPIPVEVKAYVRGKVVEVIPAEGVVVETFGSLVQGIFGIGGETHGALKVVCDSNEDVLEKDLITDDCRDKILIGGSRVTADALKTAIQKGARGIIAGGFDDQDLRSFLGYDIGVAITGAEELGITLIITEGFGKIPMARRTFDLLKNHEGQEASINGATQIRAGVIRPEAVIPRKLDTKIEEEKKSVSSLLIGNPIRIIRQPYFGKLGKVTALPPELQKLESESKARILEVELENGERVVVPRANVEMIEG